MNCPNCAAVMVTARATDFGSEYFYCRTCKKELCEMVTLEDRVPETSNDSSNYMFNPNGSITFRPGTYNVGANGGWASVVGGGGGSNTNSCNDPNCGYCSPQYPVDSADTDGSGPQVTTPPDASDGSSWAQPIYLNGSGAATKRKGTSSMEVGPHNGTLRSEIVTYQDVIARVHRQCVIDKVQQEYALPKGYQVWLEKYLRDGISMLRLS